MKFLVDAQLPARLARHRVVVTKDRDFRDGHLLRRCPRRLLVVATGNMSNKALLRIFELHLGTIITTLKESNLVEVTSDRLIIRADRADDA